MTYSWLYTQGHIRKIHVKNLRMLLEHNTVNKYCTYCSLISSTSDWAVSLFSLWSFCRHSCNLAVWKVKIHVVYVLSTNKAHFKLLWTFFNFYNFIYNVILQYHVKMMLLSRGTIFISRHDYWYKIKILGTKLSGISYQTIRDDINNIYSHLIHGLLINWTSYNFRDLAAIQDLSH
jgi:hypothetical protein